MSLQDQSGRQASPHDVIGVGIAFGLSGLYFMFGAGGYLPMPETHAPTFIGFLIGAAFLFAGLTCLVRARTGMMEHESDVPENAPPWLAFSYRMFAVGAAGALAIIGTWIAIGSGPRAFNFAGPLAETATAGETIGRTVFALSAVIAWIYVIALSVGTVRKLFDRAR